MTHKLDFTPFDLAVDAPLEVKMVVATLAQQTLYIKALTEVFDPRILNAVRVYNKAMKNHLQYKLGAGNTSSSFIIAGYLCEPDITDNTLKTSLDQTFTGSLPTQLARASQILREAQALGNRVDLAKLAGALAIQPAAPNILNDPDIDLRILKDLKG